MSRVVPLFDGRGASDPAGGAPHPIVQIVAPGRGGVLDYAERLQGAWTAAGRPNTLMTVSDADLAHRTLQDLADEALRPLSSSPGTPFPASVLLHFSGYGYQPRGLCLRLAAGAQALRRDPARRFRLVTFFHELFASGPPWKSAFWLSPLQASIAARIARASHAVITNSEAHAPWLRRCLRRSESCEVPVWPVFSTVGEPGLYPLPGPVPAHSRGRVSTAIVFGSAATRARVMRRLAERADGVAALHRLGIGALLEVGGGDAQLGEGLPGLPSRFRGRLDERDLHDLFARCRYGLIEYPDAMLGKSSVFAAYAAHGVAAVNVAQRGRPLDGPKAGLHFFSLDPLPRLSGSPRSAAAAVAAEARNWYAGHALPVQAHAFLRACSPASRPHGGRAGDQSQASQLRSTQETFHNARSL